MVLSWTTSFEFVAPHLVKANDPIPRKYLERWNDGQTLFCRNHRATANGLINIVNERLAK